MTLPINAIAALLTGAVLIGWVVGVATLLGVARKIIRRGVDEAYELGLWHAEGVSCSICRSAIGDRIADAKAKRGAP